MFGCTFALTGPSNDIPVTGQGNGLVPPSTAGGPSSTEPCAEIESNAVAEMKKLHAEFSSATSSIPRTSLVPSSSSTASSLPISLPLGDVCYQGYSKPNYTGPGPTFRDENLSGCLAMTGGSTTYTVTSGEYLPNTTCYNNGGEIATKAETVSMACSNFLSLVQAPFELLSTFQESPACTSYARWLSEHPGAPASLIPPGVVNYAGFAEVTCGGQCGFIMRTMSVLFFQTTEFHGCPVTGKTDTAYTPATKYAVVDGSTLTYPSMYLVIEGGLTVSDNIRQLGKAYTNPTIAIPPGALFSLSLSDSINGDVGLGGKTVPYDPGLPTSCRSYEFQSANTGLTTYTEWDGRTTSGSYAAVTLGPNKPFLLPPIQLSHFDPAWKDCSWASFGAQHFWTYGWVDPPRLLETEPDLMGPAGPTTESVPNPTSGPIAAPGASSLPNQPIATAAVDPESAQNPTVPSMVDPGSDPKASPVQGNDPGGSEPDSVDIPPTVNDPSPANQQASSVPPNWPVNNSPEDPAPKGGDPPQSAHQNDPASNTAAPGADRPVPDQDPQNDPDWNAAPQGAPQEADPYAQQPTTISLAPAFSRPPTTTQNTFPPSIGNIVYNAFNPAKSSSSPNDPHASPAAAAAPVAAQAPTPTVLTIANQPITIKPDIESHHLAIGSSTLKPGGPGITLSGTPMTLDSSYNLIVGSIAAANPESPTDVAPTFAGGMNSPVAISPVAVNPSVGIAPAFAGVMSAPGAASYVAYNPAATANPVAAAPVTIAGETVTPNPTGFIVGGETISPGAAGMTVSGTPVQLASGGVLVVAGSSITLPALASGSGVRSSGIVANGTAVASDTSSAGSGSGLSASASGSVTADIGDGVSSASASSISASVSTASHTVPAGGAIRGNLAEKYMHGLVVVEVIVVIILYA